MATWLPRLQSYNTKLAAELWEVSEELAKIK
jgi:hypothetical protein